MKLQANHSIRDKGGRIVIWQSPNWLLWSWIIFRVVAIVLSTGRLKSGFEQLSTATLFAWACLEVTEGVNYFRKLLGAVVLGLIVIGFFR